MAGLQPLVHRMRRSAWTADLLDGVNAGAVGLMAGVTWHLGRQAIVDVPSALLAVAALAILLRLKVSSGWLVLAGAGIGLLLQLAR